MGHYTSCIEFTHLHKRESHEILLAILKKKKKVTFHCESVNPKRAKMDFSDHDTQTSDVPKAKGFPRVKEIPPGLSQTLTDVLTTTANLTIPHLFPLQGEILLLMLKRELSVQIPKKMKRKKKYHNYKI